jgi:shikimate dehydrogenase
VFDSIPAGVGDSDLITLCGKDISSVPDGFNGLVDVGERTVQSEHRIIKSIHDFEKTPPAVKIISMLSEGDQEISKGAFKASSFTDLNSILEASKSLDRKHVLLEMGEIGEVTRIRQRILGNEFTFGYSGVSTAPGQLSADEMESLGDDCQIVGITGHPLSHTKSPAMQNAAMKAAGINGKYLVFDSPDLDNVEDVIRGYDIRGINVTIPYKERIMYHLDSVSEQASKVGAVNTVVNDNGKLIGENTDVKGIEFALRNVTLKDSRALIMGSGGAARAAAYTLVESGCLVDVAGRNRETVRTVCKEFGAEESESSIGDYDLVVNCTPIGLVEGEYPVDINGLHSEQAVFDMVYGRETPLISVADSLGCKLVDGKEMLIGQGAASFSLWFGDVPDTEVMRGALE